MCLPRYPGRVEFTLAPGEGRATVDDHLACTVPPPGLTFLDRHPDESVYLSTGTRALLVEAIDTGTRVPLDATQQRELSAFFMAVSTRVMREEMEKMRICGAASFIPPRRPGDANGQ